MNNLVPRVLSYPPTLSRSVGTRLLNENHSTVFKGQELFFLRETEKRKTEVKKSLKRILNNKQYTQHNLADTVRKE